MFLFIKKKVTFRLKIDDIHKHKSITWDFQVITAIKNLSGYTVVGAIV